VTNCTAALHLALLALGVGAGDEVLVPSLTFVATVNAVRYTGATPVFVDIVSLDDWVISAEAIRRQITPRTRAIIPMHYAGFPCDMTAIEAIAKQHELFVVEDAAHGPGSWVGTRHIGTIGDVGCFSFFANKNMTTGEGGVVVTNDGELAQKIRYLRSHGMSTMSWERHRGHAYQYDVVALGFNFRFDDMRAALGRVQLRKLVHNNLKRAEASTSYTKLLSGVSAVRIPFQRREGRVSHHLFPILLDEKIERLELMKRLRERGVQTSVHYPPAHLMSIHKGLQSVPLPHTEAVGLRELTLPLHPLLAPDDVEYVVEALRECV
jgi:dTDP-4-amino-4,6-dideoxygalactose transaminase